MDKFRTFMEKKSESWEAGYKRRVVKTTKPEHKDKGYNWRIKGKERPEISIKLYKSKPSHPYAFLLQDLRRLLVLCPSGRLRLMQSLYSP